jgi:LCP family protein required for cell wall assembly
MQLISSEDNTLIDKTLENEKLASEIDLKSLSESGTDQPSDIEIETVDAASVNASQQDEILTFEENIRINMESNQTPIMQDKDVFNILLIGSDTRKVGGNGRSDAMIVISINKKTKEIIATSLLRDIYLHIPGKSNNRINAAYALGGADLLMDTVEENFKLQIDRYISVDFFAFIDIVDAIGGVTLEVSEKDIPVINGYIEEINTLTGQEITKDQLTEEGTYLLNGKQTLGYVRNRYVGNSDFERTNRQRKVLEKIFEGVKGLNLLELNKLMNTLLPQVTTNLTQGEIFSLILSVPSFAKYDLKQWRIPIDGSYTGVRIKGMSVLGIDFEKNIKEIQRKIYGVENASP